MHPLGPRFHIGNNNADQLLSGNTPWPTRLQVARKDLRKKASCINHPTAYAYTKPHIEPASRLINEGVFAILKLMIGAVGVLLSLGS
jgi:hypothetical protein